MPTDVPTDPALADAALADATARLPPISLEDVLATAALQTRVDRKYVVPLDRFAAVVDRMCDELCVLQIGDLRQFRYESVYFDTPDLATYRQHAHGRRRRSKIRTRAYLDSGECALELKRVGARGETVKERYPYPLADRRTLDAGARELVDQRLAGLVPVASLGPVLTTAYQRATLVDPARGNRVTCDVALAFSGRGRTTGVLDGFVLLESKTVGAESSVDRALRALGSRPLALSKYCVGMAVLDPALPANRWNRELRAYFGWSPCRSPLVRVGADGGSGTRPPSAPSRT